ALLCLLWHKSHSQRHFAYTTKGVGEKVTRRAENRKIFLVVGITCAQSQIQLVSHCISAIKIQSGAVGGAFVIKLFHMLAQHTAQVGGNQLTTNVALCLSKTK